MPLHTVLKRSHNWLNLCQLSGYFENLFKYLQISSELYTEEFKKGDVKFTKLLTSLFVPFDPESYITVFPAPLII